MEFRLGTGVLKPAGLKILLGAFAALAMLGAANANVATSGRSPRVVTLMMRSSRGSNEYVAVHSAAEVFNQSQSSYRVELAPLTPMDFAQRIHDVAATGGLPCLFEVDGPYLYSFAWAGYLRPLDSFASPSLIKDVLPSIIEQGRYQGRLYSLGQFDSGLGLWANRRYLNQAGVRIPTVNAPWTLAEFEEALEKLSKVKGLAHPLEFSVYVSTSTEFYTYAFAPILKGFGGDILTGGERPGARGALNGPQSVKAMKRFQSWFTKGWAVSDVDGNDRFLAKTAALAWNGHWKYAEYRKALGRDLVLLPLPDFGAGIKTGIGSWSWVMSSTCREPEGAWRFLAYLMSPTEIERVTQANGGVPARRSVLAQSPLYRSDGPLHVFAQQLEAGDGAPRPKTANYGLVTRTFSETIRSIVGGADVKQALDKAAQIIDDDVAAHNGYPAR